MRCNFKRDFLSYLDYVIEKFCLTTDQCYDDELTGKEGLDHKDLYSQLSCETIMLEDDSMYLELVKGLIEDEGYSDDGLFNLVNPDNDNEDIGSMVYSMFINDDSMNIRDTILMKNRHLKWALQNRIDIRITELNDDRVINIMSHSNRRAGLI